jgi:hypothetical protein
LTMAAVGRSNAGSVCPVRGKARTI